MPKLFNLFWNMQKFQITHFDYKKLHSTSLSFTSSFSILSHKKLISSPNSRYSYLSSTNYSTSTYNSKQNDNKNLTSLAKVNTHNNQSIFSICLNRPESRNAISIQLLSELEKHISELKKLAQRPRALLFWSSCTNTFCAGADLKERLIMTTEEALSFLNRLNRVFTEIQSLPFPTIACIDGGALGGGLELALCCDFRVASLDSYFSLPEASLAILPGAGGTQRLSRLIGLQKAKWMAYTSSKIYAEQAEKWGVIDFLAETDINSKKGNFLYTHSDLWKKHESLLIDNETLKKAFLEQTSLKYTYEILHPLLRNSPIAISLIKDAMQRGIDLSLEEGMTIERRNYQSILKSQDRLEALQAFKEKRLPIFQGA